MRFQHRTRADYTDEEWAAYIHARRLQAEAAKSWRDALTQTGHMISAALDEELPAGNRAERRRNKRK